jgi:predicted metal-dependent hydrolase
MTFDFPVEIIRTDRSKSASIEVIDGIVNVIVPQSISEKRIEDLIKARTTWIRQKLKLQASVVVPKAKEYVNGESFTYLGRNYRLKCVKSATGDVKLKNGYLNVPVADAMREEKLTGFLRTSLEQWYFSKALEKLKEKTKRYSEILGVKPISVSIKEYKSRWGSCSTNGEVTYNWRIIIAPHHIVDYIVVHELCHLLEHNHGPKYWKHVESVVPDYRICREWLKKHGQTLII